MEHNLPVGNEWVSLPDIEEQTAAIRSLTFLTMHGKGMLSLRGFRDQPFLQPFLRLADGAPLTLSDLRWTREFDWLPSLRAAAGTFSFSMTVLPPIGERGFAVRMELCAGEAARVQWGMRGAWGGVWHCVNEEKELEGSMHVYRSAWNKGVVLDYRAGLPVFAFAPMTVPECEASFTQKGREITFSLSHTDTFLPGETKSVIFFFGLGYEEVAAATSAKHMLRRGWDWEYRQSAAWLCARRKQFASEKLTALYNTNLFFCIFFSTGRTLDTEELVCATSRSSRYYVSAAYWDRDTLLWSFPAILSADPALAKEILQYVFSRQRRHLGHHSRYIDGTLLEPGFELDELAAPVLALERYVNVTGDLTFPAQPGVRPVLQELLQKLKEVYSVELALYETFLQPTDDEIVHPFLTYDNVLVWRMLRALAKWLPEESAHLLSASDTLKNAIQARCIRHTADGRPFYAWSVDAQGRYDVYDEPPGSLQLLPYYGFCSPEDEVWRNTAAMIRSPAYRYSFSGAKIAEIGCPHAPYPWVLSLCNSLLSGHAEQALRELEDLPMDNGIACESVDPETGECVTGAAFATCAGFLCHSILSAEEGTSCETI